MQRKHNPIVSLVGLLLLVLLLVVTCTGCAAPTEAAEAEPGNWDRFNIEYCAGNLRIITDTQTGVQYLAYTTTYGTGLAVLQDAEG